LFFRNKYCSSVAYKKTPIYPKILFDGWLEFNNLGFNNTTAVQNFDPEAEMSTVFLHVGQCGNQVGLPFWKRAAKDENVTVK
jgi:hypothetical protein